jgi:hypothetical protein
MAYIVARKAGNWEVRETRSTETGPRSRTLATFTTLTPETIEHARTRASRPLDAHILRKAALRKGAPVELEGADRASGQLLAELATGRGPRPALRRLLLEALMPGNAGTSDDVRTAARWITATQQQRGETLRDLLLLADHLPPRRTHTQPSFPRIHSAPA